MQKNSQVRNQDLGKPLEMTQELVNNGSQCENKQNEMVKVKVMHFKCRKQM